MNSQTQPTKQHIYIFVILISLLFSYTSAFQSLVNKDGILYLNTAEIFLNQGLKAALQTYHWPFYSIIIATISKLTGFSLLNSAYILNSIFQTTILVLFLNLFLRFSPSRKQIWLALLTIIIFPQFNEYRHSIIKDFGYWTFCLLGIVNLCSYYLGSNKDRSSSDDSYCKSSSQSSLYFQIIHIIKNKYIILYHLCFFIAFLFRGEAVVLCSVLPLSIFLLDLNKNTNNNIIKQKLKAIYLPLISLVILISLLALITVLFFSTQMSWKELSFSLYFNLHLFQLDTLHKVYIDNIITINKYIFTQTPINFFSSICFFISGLTAVYIVKYVNVFNIFNFILLGIFFNLIRQIKIKNFIAQNITIFNTNNPGDLISSNNNLSPVISNTARYNSNLIKIILFSALIISLLPLIFLYLIFVTSGRYYILSSILLLLFVPFSLDYLWHKLSCNNAYKKYTKAINSALCLFVISITISGLVSFGYSKDYIRQAGIWYKTQELDINKSYTNNAQISFYSGIKHEIIYVLLDDKNNLNINSNNIKYLLLKIKHKDKSMLNKINELVANNDATILNKFANKRGDQVVIIKNNKFI